MKHVINHQVVLAQVPEGPLVPWLKGFADAVSDQGYARWSIGRRILLAAGFSRWLEQKNIDLRSISSGHPEQYLRYRACRQRVHPGDPSALRHLLDYLRIEAVIPPRRSRLVPRRRFSVVCRPTSAICARRAVWPRQRY